MPLSRFLSWRFWCAPSICAILIVAEAIGWFGKTFDEVVDPA